MSRILCFAGFLFVFIFILSACSKEDDTTLTPIGTVDCSTVTYSVVISALATSNCNSAACHGTGSNNGDFTTYDGIKPLADNGKLKEEVLDTQEMPQGGGSLTSEQLGQFKCWLDAGAPNN